jgi:hypothetical protein
MQLSKRQKLWLVGGGIVVGLLLGEILARLVTPVRLRELVRGFKGERQKVCTLVDERLDHRLRPNCEGLVKTEDFEFKVSSNALGLREREVDVEKEKGKYRVLMLGDSFAMGWGVEQENRFSEVATKLLKQGKEGEKDRVEMINAGINSYSSVLELEYLRYKGIEFNPDLVMVFLDFSDLHDDYFYGGWQRQEQLRQALMPGSEEPVKEQIRRKERWFDWLIDKSKLFNYGFTRLVGAGLNFKQRLGWENLSTNILIYERAMDWEEYDKAWNLPLANLRLMKEYLEGEEIEMVVVIVPKGIFFEDEWQEGRKLAGFKPGVYDWGAVKMIESKLRQLGIKVIDWHKVFLTANKDEQLFYDNDGHWTIKGNQVAGKELARFLQGAARGEL